MDIFQPYIDSAYQRFLQWKGSDICVVFPIITDLHSALDTVDCLNSQKRETLSHILIMNRAAKKFNADFTANLGDNGIDVPVKDDDKVQLLIDRLYSYHNQCTSKPALFAIGNHDIKCGITPEFWGSISKQINKGYPINFQEYGTYGYYDISEKRTRVFFLFCNETADYHSESQLAFVEENLNNLPANWCAVVMQHICMHPLGRWQKGMGTPEKPKYVRLRNIFSSFVKNGGKLAGVFSGDSHFNLLENLDKVTYYSCQGYGGIGPSEAPSHALKAHEFCPALNRTDSFNSETTCLIDMVAVKPDKRETAVFRVGAEAENFTNFFKF